MEQVVWTVGEIIRVARCADVRETGELWCGKYLSDDAMLFI